MIVPQSRVCGEAGGRLFGLILEFCCFFCLPLHVAWTIGAAPLEWFCMINDVAGATACGLASGRAGVGFPEVVFGAGATLDVAVCIAANAQ